MNKPIYIIAIFILCISISTHAQSGEICKWNGDMKAAIVLTFDDWSPGHYPIVVSELAKRDLTATFFPIITSITEGSYSWSDIKTTLSYGNEMGNHSKTHPALPGLNNEQLGNEIRGAKEIIEQNTPIVVNSFNYPYGAYSELVIDSVIKTGHIAARGVNSPSNYTYNFATANRDYYTLHTFGMKTSTHITEFSNEIEKVTSGGGLLIFMYHSVDDSIGSYNDNWYEKVLQHQFQEQLDTLLAKQNQVWVTTMEQAVKYHREANCAKLSIVKPFDGNELILNLSDTLTYNEVFNQPLTIKWLTKGETISKVTQNGIEMPIVYTNKDTILFQAIPDNGEIKLLTNRTADKRMAQTEN